MTPSIPYQFTPSAENFEEEHLDWQPQTNGAIVTWPLIGARIFVSPDYIPDTLSQVNNGTFKSYGKFGFSLSDYSEFLISMPYPNYCTFKMSGIEASFGDATPLAAFIFNPYFRSKWFGPWDSIMSLRIIGARLDEAEISFLNAMAHYEEKYGTLPDLFPIDPDLILLDEEREQDEKTYSCPPMTTNIEPLRFYYNALSQVEDVPACIYFYRVLEYFSFFTNSTELSRLRHDGSISDADFSRKIIDLISRDEKGPLFRLITSLTDSTILDEAIKHGLTKSTGAGAFCEALYGFRNSIVHGKFIYGYPLHSHSAIVGDTILPKWKTILRTLARLALQRYGTKRV